MAAKDRGFFWSIHSLHFGWVETEGEERHPFFLFFGGGSFGMGFCKWVGFSKNRVWLSDSRCPNQQDLSNSQRKKKKRMRDRIHFKLKT